MPGRASTTTSLYSDDPTEVPPLPTTFGVREGKLIDYDEPHVEHQEEEEKMVNPTDKLRELLNQMRKEVEINRPVNSLAYSEDEQEVRPRRQRDDAVASNNAGLSSPPRKRYGEESEDEEQSPPTPPPRIGNPYAARRGERRNSPNLPSSQPGRLPSRAAVLRNSTIRSPPSPEPIQPQPRVKSPPTRLEAFLASSTSSIHPIAKSSTSGQLQTNLMRKDSGSSTSSSRKGKDRAISPILSLPQETQSISSRRNRFRQTPPPEAVKSHRRPQTPRRISVDLAPEDMSSFARNAVDLEVRGEVELDLDEGLSALGWEESSQSVIEDSVDIPQSQRRGHEDNLRRSTSRSPDRRDRSRNVQPRFGSISPIQSRQGVDVHSSIGKSQTRHSSISPENNQRNSQPRYLSSSPPAGNALRRSHNQNRFPDGQTQPVDSPPRNSRHTSPRHGDSSPSPPLPALPEPDMSAQSEISEIDTYSSRRAALIRSTSRSASGSTSTSTARSGSQTPSQSFGTATGLRSRLSQRSSVERSEEVSEGDILPKRSPTKWKRSSLQKDTPESIHGRTSPVPLTRQSSNLPSPVRKEYTPPRGVEDIPIPIQDPIQVNIALAPPSLSTPTKSANPNVSTLLTPKPPGAWQPISKPKVRFSPSPLSQHSPIRPDTPSRDESEEGVSTHRLRVSPRRSPKAKTISKEQEQEQEVGNESFLGRLKGSLSSPLKKTKIQIPIPPKSNTFTLSTTSLQHAKSTTTAAEQNLLITQKQWLEALSAINTAANTSSTVVRKGWGWSTWVLWGLVEVLILWSVFRATLDYATSLTHISTLDPFHPLSLPFRQSTTSTSTWSNGPFGSISLELSIPSALQTLVGGNGGYGNVNFFDLMESWGIWSKFFATPVAGGGGRMLAGGVGGVPS
ncbi:hypothetical protein L486_00557 [Kwoniella mangroviensis CBS 10435]|uniref:Uncharacterized protein n=1 Tax=Kwoniella mangroviensis CBS 10435 TaxID=1331196 RepID=A0A1B9IZG9_9TREE|nr:hypothetical protein L486_00557 [Kwoniella mangroviensis CBS 10435]